MKEVSRAIILNTEGKVLLGKRTRGSGAGQFALIGGKPDAGETPKDAVVREVKEEVGLNFAPTPYLERVDESSPTDPWMVYYFTGPYEGELTLNPHEVESIVFASEEDLDATDIAFDHKDRLKEFFQTHRIPVSS